MRNFGTIPGQSGVYIDSKALSEWIDQVRQLAEQGKLAAITDQYIGHVFAHSCDDPDGAWPKQEIRDQIERLKSEELELGIQTERFNMRGVHTRGVYQGGSEERAFATQYRAYADAVKKWPRTEKMLRRIADSWDSYAKQEDVWAEQRKMKD
jgi:hypothetical protein